MGFNMGFSMGYTQPGNDCYSLLLNMAVAIVDLPSYNMVIFQFVM